MGQPVSGFSLVEMAIAVFVMALLLGSILVPLQSQVRSRKLEETDRLLAQAREALLGYVVANGYFPCPASSTSNGQEASPNHANGTCDAAVTSATALVGFLPAVTLGFTPVDGSGYALDAWGLTQNRVRYAIANATINSVTNPFTKTGGMRNATMAGIQSATTLLYVCRTGTGVTTSGCAASTDDLSDNAIAVIWSLGENAPTGGSAPHEDKNLDNNRVFVSAPYSQVTGSEFDDQLTWIGPPMLFNRMVSVGLLP
ncbi:MAG TPA: type II secretion system protein [Burkholderiales bacterium]|nr:type II secretion system protein [Burkholderiales bacterium]